MSMTLTPQKEIKLIAVYARVSTSNQENEGTIETQLAAVNDFAKEKNYTIVQEYRDNGWSGDSIVRPALDQLRMDVKNKVWEAVLMYDPDRLARRYSYQELVLDELREAGIEVLFVTTSAPKSEEDKILYGVKGLFAQYERAKITERFRIGKIRKVRDGNILTTVAPYGYTYILNQKIPNQPKKHGYYVINEDEARVVRMIFGWVANDGLTIRKVVTELQKLGIKPRKSKRGVWSTSTLTTLLRHKVYIGQAHWGSSYAVVPGKPLKFQQYKKIKKTSRKIKPEEEWIASKIPVPPIIDEALFAKARERLKSNYDLCKRNRKNHYLLAGKIRCVCGRTRAGEGPQRGKHLYYRCTDRVLSFPLPRTCNERGINARIADKLVWNKLVELMSSPELLEKQIHGWQNNQRSRVKSAVGDTKTMEAEISKLKIQEDRYNKAYGAGVFTMEQLQSYTVPAREQIASLEVQIAKAKQQANQISDASMPSADEIKSFADESAQVLPTLSFDLKRAIVTRAVRQIIGSQQKLDVSGQLDMEMLALPPALSNHVEYETFHRNSRLAQCRQVNAF